MQRIRLLLRERLPPPAPGLDEHAPDLSLHCPPHALTLPGALWNLSVMHESNQALIGEAGAVPLLVEMMRKGSAPSATLKAAGVRGAPITSPQVGVWIGAGS